MAGPAPGTDRALATRLDALFRSRDGRPWTNDEVAAHLKLARPDLRVSGAYLSALRTGKRTSPALELLIALAEFFEVSVAHLTGAPQDAQAAGADGHEMRDDAVRAVALRAVGLDSEGLRAVTSVLDHVRRLQGLPPVGDDGAAGGRDPGDGAPRDVER